jgi:hypothetical protein
VRHVIRRLEQPLDTISWDVVTQPEDKERVRIAEPMAAPPDYEDVFSLLLGGRFGYSANLIGPPALRIDTGRDEAVRLLNRCLATGLILPWSSSEGNSIGTV